MAEEGGHWKLILTRIARMPLSKSKEEFGHAMLVIVHYCTAICRQDLLRFVTTGLHFYCDAKQHECSVNSIKWSCEKVIVDDLLLVVQRK